MKYYLCRKPVIVLLVAFLCLTFLHTAFSDSHAQNEGYTTEHYRVRVVTVARGLENPWGMAFLPDGRMLVTERPGRLRYIDGRGIVSKPLTGVPKVFARGQGGLLDVALDPDFAKNRLVYLSYAQPGKGGGGTAVGRGRLIESRLEDFKVIFRQVPKANTRVHFGSRLVFSRDGKLFITIGERGNGNAPRISPSIGVR